MSSVQKKLPRRRPHWRNQHDIFGYFFFLVMSGLYEIIDADGPCRYIFYYRTVNLGMMTMLYSTYSNCNWIQE